MSTGYADYTDFVLKDTFVGHSNNLCNLRNLWIISVLGCGLWKLVGTGQFKGPRCGCKGVPVRLYISKNKLLGKPQVNGLEYRLSIERSPHGRCHEQLKHAQFTFRPGGLAGLS